MSISSDDEKVIKLCDYLVKNYNYERAKLNPRIWESREITPDVRFPLFPSPHILIFENFLFPIFSTPFICICLTQLRFFLMSVRPRKLIFPVWSWENDIKQIQTNDVLNISKRKFLKNWYVGGLGNVALTPERYCTTTITTIIASSLSTQN